MSVVTRRGTRVEMLFNIAVFGIFALLWVAFAGALVLSQGSLDATWQWIASQHIVVQAILWLLFLPVVAGLWVWETTWPFLVRIVLVAGLAWINLYIFFPRAATVVKP